MKIVCVASEGVPFAKTGGLADVAGALPRALRSLGHTTCLFLPCHRRVWTAGPELVGTGLTLQVPVGSVRSRRTSTRAGCPVPTSRST